MKDFFGELTPEKILAACECTGAQATGRIYQLNSLENRVYEIEVEEGLPIIGKFYRADRWTKEQILEEHEFLNDLIKAEIPAVAPLELSEHALQKSPQFFKKIHKTTLGETNEGHFFTLFPKARGRAPDELSFEQAKQLGRLVARMHAVGVTKAAKHRVEMNPRTYGTLPLDFLIKGNWVGPELKTRYETTAREIIEKISPLFKNIKTLRIHGDCHLGNLLFNGPQAFFLDFDDMVVGPSVQDIWLATPVSPDDEISKQVRADFILGYEEMREFDPMELKLIEPLRALRIINYSAWIAKRWEDPFFKRIFPSFGDYKYWATEVENLESILRAF